MLCGQEGWNTYDLELPFTYEAVLLGLFAAACALPVAEILASLLYRRPVHEKISESEKRWRRVRFVLSDIVGAVVTVVVVATSVYYSAVWLGRTGRSTSAARKSWIFAGFVATIAQVRAGCQIGCISSDRAGCAADVVSMPFTLSCLKFESPFSIDPRKLL